jgi:hypothetical protein
MGSTCSARHRQIRVWSPDEGECRPLALVRPRNTGLGGLSGDVKPPAPAGRSPRVNARRPGEREPFGVPPRAPARTVVTVGGDHSLKSDLPAVAAAVRGWLRLVSSLSGRGADRVRVGPAA